MSAKSSFERHATLLPIILIGIGFLHCKARPNKKLEIPEGCLTPEMVSCLKPYAFEELSNDDLERLANEGMPRCVSSDRKVMARQWTCLPLTLGGDQHGRPVVVQAYPRSISLIYAAPLTLEACCKAGGVPREDGYGYGGCMVPEFVRMRYEGGMPTQTLCDTLKEIAALAGLDA